MKNLQDILYKVTLKEVYGSTAVSVSSIVLDSRKAKKHSLFVAVRGTQVDGHSYIDKAIEQGATVVVCEEMPLILKENITYIKTDDSSKALALIASNFYDNPSSELKLIAVTGTNGKTSIATLLYNLYTALGYKCGLLSTVEIKIGKQIIDATHTTPDAITINTYLNDMLEAGCDYCFMEASSHAIHQNRTFGLDINGAVFTNITHDHLDYHKTFKEYIVAKKKLFDELPKTAFALVNVDDKNGKIMLQNTKAKPYHYALKNNAHFRAKLLENDLNGLMLLIDGSEIHVRLIGAFNAYNLLAVYGVAIILGTDKEEILRALSMIPSAEGRFETVYSSKKRVVGIVDYAHTPDALKNVLETINELSENKQIITVVGCGGDRDKTKRPAMAELAAKMSHQVILTSDNPRTENPEVILDEMEKGIPIHLKKKVLRITNRAQAIKTACRLANERDIILVAGKGHEKYQEINGVKTHFDDKEQLINAFKELAL